MAVFVPTRGLVRWVGTVTASVLFLGLLLTTGRAEPSRRPAVPVSTASPRPAVPVSTASPRPAVPALAASPHQAPPPRVARRPRTAAEALARLRAFKEQYEQLTKKYYEARILLGRRRAEAAVQTQRPAAAMVAAAVRLEHELAARKAGLARLAAEIRALYQRLSTSERRALLRARVAASARAAASLRAGRSNRPTQAVPVDMPASGRGAIAVQWAKKQLGKPYVWAADGPDVFDCSGLTMYVWAKAGVSLPHSSTMQISAGSRVSRSELRPGDLVFFYSPIHHVGIYVGDGIMIHAPRRGDVVRYATIASQPFAGASRPG